MWGYFERTTVWKLKWMASFWVLYLNLLRVKDRLKSYVKNSSHILHTFWQGNKLSLGYSVHKFVEGWSNNHAKECTHFRMRVTGQKGAPLLSLPNPIIQKFWPKVDFRSKYEPKKADLLHKEIVRLHLYLNMVKLSYVK